jgi:uncharacterized protein (DUF427 family)
VPADYELRFEPSKKRVRVVQRRVDADSERALVVCETRLPPAYYFPAADVRMDLLAKTAHTTPVRSRATRATGRGSSASA